MKRQAVMICGVSCRTSYLLIDEAFDGLDQTMRSIIKKILIDAMLDNDLTVIFSSHNLSEIDEFCDRVGLLHGGKVVFDRDLDDVESDIVKIRAAFDRDITAADLPDIEILHIEKSGSLTEIIAKGGAQKVRAAAEKLSPKLIDDMRLSLKEIFIYEMEGVGYDSSSLDG
jgi:ABC-2 type transport system ATP-binding protein